MPMNQLQKALVNAGFAEWKERKPRKGKQFKCRKCGSAMHKSEETNVMSCTNPKCNSFYVFSNKQD